MRRLRNRRNRRSAIAARAATKTNKVVTIATNLINNREQNFIPEASNNQNQSLRSRRRSSNKRSASSDTDTDNDVDEDEEQKQKEEDEDEEDTEHNSSIEEPSNFIVASTEDTCKLQLDDNAKAAVGNKTCTLATNMDIVLSNQNKEPNIIAQDTNNNNCPGAQNLHEIAESENNVDKDIESQEAPNFEVRSTRAASKLKKQQQLQQETCEQINKQDTGQKTQSKLLNIVEVSKKRRLSSESANALTNFIKWSFKRNAPIDFDEYNDESNPKRVRLDSMNNINSEIEEKTEENNDVESKCANLMVTNKKVIKDNNNNNDNHHEDEDDAARQAAAAESLAEFKSVFRVAQPKVISEPSAPSLNVRKSATRSSDFLSSIVDKLHAQQNHKQQQVQSYQALHGERDTKVLKMFANSDLSQLKSTNLTSLSTNNSLPAIDSISNLKQLDKLINLHKQKHYQNLQQQQQQQHQDHRIRHHHRRSHHHNHHEHSSKRAASNEQVSLYLQQLASRPHPPHSPVPLDDELSPAALHPPLLHPHVDSEMQQASGLDNNPPPPTLVQHQKQNDDNSREQHVQAHQDTNQLLIAAAIHRTLLNCMQQPSSDRVTSPHALNKPRQQNDAPRRQTPTGLLKLATVVPSSSSLSLTRVSRQNDTERCTSSNDYSYESSFVSRHKQAAVAPGAFAAAASSTGSNSTLNNSNNNNNNNISQLNMRLASCIKQIRNSKGNSNNKSNNFYSTTRPESHTNILSASGASTSLSSSLNQTVASQQQTDFECDTCGSSFDDRHRLMQHQSIHLELKKDWFTETPVEEVMKFFNRRRGEFHCEPCNLRFEATYDYDRHNNTVHGPRPYSCQFCGNGTRTFVAFRSMLNHLYDHRYIFKCKLENCDFSVNRRDSLRFHIFRFHLNCQLPATNVVSNR